MRISAPAIAAAVLLATACGSKRIDLLPEPRGGSTDLTAFCVQDEEGRLSVHVRNQGSDAARATTTLIQFESGPPVVLPTKPIAPGEKAVVSFVLADICRQRRCRFRIQVDARDEIQETDESNNLVQGACDPSPP